MTPPSPANPFFDYDPEFLALVDRVDEELVNLDSRRDAEDARVSGFDPPLLEAIDASSDPLSPGRPAEATTASGTERTVLIWVCLILSIVGAAAAAAVSWNEATAIIRQYLPSAGRLTP